MQRTSYYLRGFAGDFPYLTMGAKSIFNYGCTEYRFQQEPSCVAPWWSEGLSWLCFATAWRCQLSSVWQPHNGLRPKDRRASCSIGLLRPEVVDSACGSCAVSEKAGSAFVSRRHTSQSRVATRPSLRPHKPSPCIRAPSTYSPALRYTPSRPGQ